jgi:NADH-quinone oxidoreductase subunit M
MGAFEVSTWLAALAATGVILGAAYMLYVYRRIIFGVLEKESLKDITDLSPREIAVFAPLVILVFWMGIYPASFLDMMAVSVDNLIANYTVALLDSGVTVAHR